MLERTLTRFVRSLRSAGMQVSSAEAIDAARALALVGYADREAMKASLRIVMSKSEEDDAVFGDLFDTFFSAVQADRQAQAQQQAREAEAGQQEGAEQAQPSSGSPSEGERAGSPSSGGPSDADAFMTLAQSGDATAISVAMARAATAAGADDIRFASQTAFFVRKMLEQLGVQQVEAQLQAALAERGADARRRAQAIIEANEYADFDIISGKTVAGNEFFLEQFRLDGALCMETAETKMGWLRWLQDNGVVNIEMEGAMIAGYLNHWGFSKFAMICATIFNRLENDQMTSTPEQLQKFSEDSGVALFNYLAVSLLGA